MLGIIQGGAIILAVLGFGMWLYGTVVHSGVSRKCGVLLMIVGTVAVGAALLVR